MFKLIDDPTFTRTVKVLVPVDGGHRAESFGATFRALPVSEARAFDLDAEDGTRAFLERVLVAADDIADADGAPLPWSDELKAWLLDVPYARLALARAYFEAVTKAREGN